MRSSEENNIEEMNLPPYSISNALGKFRGIVYL
jgi:hypothetical protein